MYNHLRQSTTAPRSFIRLPKYNQATTQQQNPQSPPPAKSPKSTSLPPQQPHMSPQSCLHTRKGLWGQYILHQVRSISNERTSSNIHHIIDQKKEQLQTKTMCHQKQKNPRNHMTFRSSQNTQILIPKILNKSTQHQNSLQVTCPRQLLTHLQKRRKIMNQLNNPVRAMSPQNVCILHQQKQPQPPSIQ